ncbi:MAG: phosphatase PAP2 family protein [Parachlamydiales bacterium]|nr:phosphatase PAP2 family protein [Parachlamydiales bacterium]
MNKKILPHELLFGVFMLLTYLRLIIKTHFNNPYALTLLAFIILNVILILKKEGNLSWRFRLSFYPLTMNTLFVLLGNIVPIIHPQKEDLFLQKIDSWLIGGNLSLKIESFIHPLVTEIMTVGYSFFWLYILITFFHYLFSKLEVAKKFYIGLFTIYSIGLICYTYVPAIGPYVAMSEQFSVPLEGYFLTKWLHFIVPIGTNGCDVFPSLHCAVSSYILFFDRVYTPRRYRWCLPICILIWISTIYLRYHYFIDLLVGFALVPVALKLAFKYEEEQNDLPVKI